MLNTTDQLIAEVHRYGAALRIVDGRLKTIPPGRLPTHLKAELREAAAEIKARLQTATQPLPCPGAGAAQTEIDRIARLDAERCEADRQANRGYDFDPSAPSHIEREEAEIDRLASIDGWRLPPAHSIVATCQRAGVALRIDKATGALVVGKAGAKPDAPTQPWPSLLIAIEAHLEAVAALVEGGWNLRADFPQGEVA
jgi:hypothetical protein